LSDGELQEFSRKWRGVAIMWDLTSVTPRKGAGI
jgi:hypothetical protein